LGYVGRPGAKTWSPHDAAFNRFGMLPVPGRRYPVQTTDDRLVIGVLGGSVASMFANQAEADLGRFLADAAPAFQDREVWLVDLATGGYKQPQQLFHLEYAVLSGFQFDAVVNIDGFNDLALAVENMDNGLNYIYPSGNHYAFVTKVLKGDFSPQNVLALSRLYRALIRERRVSRWANRAPWRYSPLANTAAWALTRRFRRDVRRIEYDLVVGLVEKIPDDFRGPKLDPGPDRHQAAVRVWKQSSLMLDAVCRALDVPYFHFLQPNQYVDGSKPLSAGEKKTAYNPDQPRVTSVRRGYGLLAEAGRDLADQGVAFQDLRFIFQNETADLYIDECCHFNEQGNRIMARAVAHALAEGLTGP
jgi:hypothetical protein